MAPRPDKRSKPARRAKTAKRKQPAKRRQPETDPLAGPKPERPQCAAKTAKGKRCKHRALEGADRCANHLGKRGGRPTKLTDELTGQLVELLEKGVPRETAAVALGIGTSTFYDWLRLGDPEETLAKNEPYRVFRRRVEQARDEGIRKLVETIATANDWRAQAWLAARLDPDKFAGQRGTRGAVHPDAFAGGEASGPEPENIKDDQVGPDGSPL